MYKGRRIILFEWMHHIFHNTVTMEDSWLLPLHLPVGVHPVDPGEVRLPGHLEQAVPGGGARLSYKVLHMKIEKTFLFEDLGWIFIGW